MGKHFLFFFVFIFIFIPIKNKKQRKDNSLKSDRIFHFFGDFRRRKTISKKKCRSKLKCTEINESTDRYPKCSRQNSTIETFQTFVSPKILKNFHRMRTSIDIKRLKEEKRRNPIESFDEESTRHWPT